ncbi:hypothetical protein PV403_22890 [Paenibacillus sp. GYB006]|uniref:hypothetical protein n=1 Tax=Paenibacillus sp. GYB006 TaxID=2994394 RepID=UPI002F96A7A2
MDHLTANPMLLGVDLLGYIRHRSAFCSAVHIKRIRHLLETVPDFFYKKSPSH